MREVLFKTVHGSRLYGLSHAGSDEDFYTVVTKMPVGNDKHAKAKYAKHTINNEHDSFVIDFGTWVEQCKSGVPQALEAMFSDMTIGDDRIQDFRNSFYCGTAVSERYLRTIKSFALTEDTGIKKRRHALRLALNLREMGERGRFNPTLSPEDVAWCTDMAHKSHEDVYGLALCWAWE